MWRASTDTDMTCSTCLEIWNALVQATPEAVRCVSEGAVVMTVRIAVRPMRSERRKLKIQFRDSEAELSFTEDSYSPSMRERQT